MAVLLARLLIPSFSVIFLRLFGGEMFGPVLSPPSRSALTWRLMLNRFPTEDRLCRSGFQLASCCSICGVSSGSADHLFLHFPLAVALWEAFSLLSSDVSLPKLGNPSSCKPFSEANRLDIGCMHNCMDDLLILRRFGLQGCPSKAPVIKSVIWSPPAPGWIKVNTDGVAMGSPGFGGIGGIFRNCRAFVKGCFAIPLGQVFAFKAELLAASLAINFAWKYGWHRLWLESDSSYVV
ncbi:hypothetical protein LWI28_019629 [Acer negundo]|uniref:RNase H type-1 domain-containing protein n=1 Tax=Acer negundo TaxID=4023 RepID=A0AAD5JBT2_ACENE|nr:hypothetical protein LWI28_019629 [Acer negundo]